MTRITLLKQRQEQLRQDCAAMLDSFLIGTVAKSPAMSGHNLTNKVKGKTVTLYVRKAVAPQALEMSRRYQALWTRVQELSKINWELLNLENP